jgi:hypothetical protein
MTTDGRRAVPPVSWEHASLQQIRDSLRPDESEEDIYRVVDQLDVWATELEGQLADHERHWAAMSGSSAGNAHSRAAVHSAQTRANLAAVLDDVHTMRASLDSLAAAFVAVREKVDRLYEEYQSTRGHMLDWVLTRDDEPTEKSRRDITQWARSLMAQYEQIANEELGTWPRGHRLPGGSVTTGASTATTVPLRDTQAFAGDNRPTKPLRPGDGQQPTSASGMGAAFPGGAFAGEDEAVRNNPFQVDEQLFDPNGDAFPPVIGADNDYEKGEGDSW